MSRHPELYQWHQQLASHFPGLAPPFVAGLALWSFGMALGRRCGLVAVARQLVPLLGQRFDTVRQRLREFYQEAAAKAGAKRGSRRRDFAAADCFAPLLAWVLTFWQHRRLALALDVTNLGDRLHILCVSVLCGGVGIPVAWKILPGNCPGAWNPHWDELLRRLRRAVGDDWQVVVLSDRGLESAALFGVIVGLGWHPLMRVKGGGTFRPAGWARWYAFRALLGRPGGRGAWAGQAYKSVAAPLPCTLLGCWDERHTEPWLLLTDLPPRAANPCWYAWRAWIEQGFKVIKGGGLHWQNTRMRDVGRLERLWLAIAVATLWLVAIGAAVERREATETIGALPEGGRGGAPAAGRRRVQRLFLVGMAELVGALVRGAGLPAARLDEPDWPEPPHDLPTMTEQEFVSGLTYS